MNVLDLFSGIGGFSLGLEWAGFRTVAFCEVDPFCRRVLAKHWPGVRCYDDVRTLTADRLKADGITADVICGGFPCQDISVAGRGAGLAGERSGLWNEFARLIGELGPRYVIVENVAALLGRGLADILGDLAALGFDAEWHCIPASAVGAPHQRDRIWVVAYPEGFGCGARRPWRLAYSLAWLSNAPRWNPTDSDRAGLAQREGERSNPRPEQPAAERNPGVDVWQSCWPDEPALCGVDDGLPGGMDPGLFALGNAVVPQIPEIIGRAILMAEQEQP